MTDFNPFEIRDEVLRGVIEPLRNLHANDVLTNVAVCEAPTATVTVRPSFSFGVRGTRSSVAK
jgi:hypothetical protein